MFARTSVIAMLTLPLLAAAIAITRDEAPPASQCVTGPVQCCNSAERASSLSYSTTLILALAGVNINTLTGYVGLTCSDLTVIGAGGNSCTAQPLCCTNHNFHGLFALGCSPVNLNL